MTASDAAATTDTVERRRLGIAQRLIAIRVGRHDDDLVAQLKKLTPYQLRALARLVDEAGS